MEFKMNETGFYSELEFEKLMISSHEESGFRPYQLMIASLAGCSGGMLRSILNKMRLDVKDIIITAEVDREEELPKKIRQVNLHFLIDGQDLDQKKLEKALKLAKKHCSMVQSVLESIEVNESISKKSS